MSRQALHDLLPLSSFLLRAGSYPCLRVSCLASLFGHRVVTPKPIMVALPALFESKDGKAREKVKEIVVRMGGEACRRVLQPVLLFSS